MDEKCLLVFCYHWGLYSAFAALRTLDEILDFLGVTEGSERQCCHSVSCLIRSKLKFTGQESNDLASFNIYVSNFRFEGWCSRLNVKHFFLVLMAVVGIAEALTRCKLEVIDGEIAPDDDDHRVVLLRHQRVELVGDEYMTPVLFLELGQFDSVLGLD